METMVRITAEHLVVGTGEVLESKICKETIVKDPKMINEMGYQHIEQIEVIKSIQNFKIKHQSVLINQSDICPNCNGKAHSKGIVKSKFHAALTDHDVFIRSRKCMCGWKSERTIEGLYGSNIHSDLLEKHSLQGSENSFNRASKNLNDESNSIRPINNDDRIRRSVEKVGKIVEINKLKKVPEVEEEKAVTELISVVDGGHVKSKDENSRSFEAMVATVYHPSKLKVIDKHHKKITQKTSVASALSDEQKAIKQLIVNACRKEGMNSKVTTLTCLTDGAKNCWSITNYLKSYAKKIINVLDWFHITKKITIISKTIQQDLKPRLDKVKWHLWHGNSKKALSRLNEIISDVSDETTGKRLADLYEYIKRNQKYLVNYQKRKEEGLPFSSALAESSVNSVINIRQKRSQKMQWSRDGSHNILQIRTSIFSESWKEDWKLAQKSIYKKAA